MNHILNIYRGRGSSVLIRCAVTFTDFDLLEFSYQIAQENVMSWELDFFECERKILFVRARFRAGHLARSILSYPQCNVQRQCCYIYACIGGSMNWRNLKG